MDLCDKRPADLRDSVEARFRRSLADRTVYNIVYLIYRANNNEGDYKDCEFFRPSMPDHWSAGYYDVVCTLRHPCPNARTITRGSSPSILPSTDANRGLR